MLGLKLESSDVTCLCLAGAVVSTTSTILDPEADGRGAFVGKSHLTFEMLRDGVKAAHTRLTQILLWVILAGCPEACEWVQFFIQKRDGAWPCHTEFMGKDADGYCFLNDETVHAESKSIRDALCLWLHTRQFFMKVGEQVRSTAAYT